MTVMFIYTVSVFTLIVANVLTLDSNPLRMSIILVVPSQAINVN